MNPKKPAHIADPSTRYLARHTWYADEATALVRELQAVVWPFGWHITMGGGVLTHGYSDKDLDLYIMPMYGEGFRHNQLHDTANLLDKLEQAGLTIVEELAASLQQMTPHNCYAFSGHMEYSSTWAHSRKRVDLFVVRP